jgi:hypothetical protein
MILTEQLVEWSLGRNTEDNMGKRETGLETLQCFQDVDSTRPTYRSLVPGAHHVPARCQALCFNSSMSPDRTSQSQSRRRARKATVRVRSASPCLHRPHVDAYDNASELKGIPAKLQERVREIANDYLCQCRELARDAKGEAE